MKKLERALPAMLGAVAIMWVAVAVLYRIFAAGSPLTVVAIALAAVFFALSWISGVRARSTSTGPRGGHG